MNPNSANQRWSKWTIIVAPKVWRPLNFETVRDACARFARRLYGSSSQMKVERCLLTKQWILLIRSEGHPVHDPEYVEWFAAQWRMMFTYNFPQGVDVKVEAKLEAGSRQDGTPADQLVILPSLKSLLEGV